MDIEETISIFFPYRGADVWVVQKEHHRSGRAVDTEGKGSVAPSLWERLLTPYREAQKVTGSKGQEPCSRSTASCPNLAPASGWFLLDSDC